MSEFKTINEDYMSDLYEAILCLKTKEEVALFLQDLCTPQERIAISQRYQIAKLLTEKHPYAEIMEKTSTSTATISRVNRSLRMATAGGYAIVFERLAFKKKGSQ